MMGYHTDFDGCFTLDKPLAPNHAAYLLKFAETRRMKRDEKKTAKRPDPVREAVGLPVGPEGAYFVGEGGLSGQGEREEWPEKDPHGKSVGIVGYNDPPEGQPSLWCQWVPRSTQAVYTCPECEKKRKKGNYEYLSLHDNKCSRCGWTAPDPVYDVIQWDEGEKFYEYVAWIGYLIEHFLKPWGYVLNGEVSWRGEDSNDRGVIYVKNNRVQAIDDQIVSPEPVWDEED